MFVFVLVMVAGVTGIRTMCDGGNCTINSDCNMPSGTGGTLTSGKCCSSKCYANYPKVAKGGACNTADPCMGCAGGLSCANSAGQIQGGMGVSGPFTCQPIISKFSVGCKCANNSQCIAGSFCGSQNSVCMANSLYSDSGCDFGVQCISGYCDGSCRGRDLLVPNSCSSNNECPLGKRCSTFGVPGTMMCHDLSAIGGTCYSVGDCMDYYGQLNTNVECVKTKTGSDVGRCTRYSNLGEVCSTSTTTTNCAWYSQDNGDGTTSQNRYTCNTTEIPPRCRQMPLAAVGQVCDSKLLNVSKCVPTAYCELNTKQPCSCCTNNCPNPGVCSTKYNIPLGGNCSDLSVACAKPNYCTKKGNATYYTCTAPVDGLGTTCNHTSPVLDTIQCYDDVNGGTLYCACNDTCQKPLGSSSLCTSQSQNLAASALLNSFPSTATPAVAMYDKHKENLLAYEYCCSLCNNQAERAKMTSDTGVIVDCNAKTIKTAQVCDSSATLAPYLQNCDLFKAAATMPTVSLYLIALLSLLSIFILV